MIGNHQLQFGSEQFISGMASSDFSTDGALGTSCTGLNPFVTPGVIRPLGSSTDISTNVAGNIIASCEDSSATSPNNRYFIDDASASANYYSFNGTTITKVKTGSATYIAGKSDFISFAGFFYGTTASKLTQWDGTNGAGLNETFQSLGDGSAHHPMIIYQGFLFVGDGNTLSTLANDNTTYATSVLVLSSKEKIVALGIDPMTGLMMISVQTVYDVSDTIPSLKAIYLYDGISSKPTRKILVDDLITAFYNVEGTVYIGSGQTLGMWNGNGVTFLRKLMNVTLSNTDLPYKHHFTNIGKVLHVVDGQSILSYGSVIYGKKGFFYTASNPTGSGHLSIVMPLGSNKMGIAYTTNKVSSFDFSSTSSGLASMYFNNTYFPRPTFIRRIRVITTGITTTNGLGGVTFFDEKENQFNTQIVTFKVVSTFSPQYVFDFDYTNAKVQAIQPRINFDTQGFGVVRVIIYYDPAE